MGIFDKTRIRLYAIYIIKSWTRDNYCLLIGLLSHALCVNISWIVIAKALILFLFFCNGDLVNETICPCPAFRRQENVVTRSGHCPLGQIFCPKKHRVSHSGIIRAFFSIHRFAGRQYLKYIDFKTLSCLFFAIAAICVLRNIRFFTLIARKIVSVAGNLKPAVLLILYITFIVSMLIANDMALITFLPLGYIILKETNQEKHAAFVFILQNISANLGGMLTPLGNPQNLFL